MDKMLALVGLLFCTTLQAGSQAATELVIPTKMAVSPELFERGQVASVKASFKQLALICGPGATRGFEVRLYDEKDVSGEPVYTQSKETKYIARSIATVALASQDDNNKVERDFEQFQIPQNAPSRLYAVIWEGCSWKIRKGNFDPPIYEEKRSTKRIGGQFFKFSCPGTGKLPTGKCAYRLE